MSNTASLIQSLAPWRRLLCCFGLHSFDNVPNAASLSSVDLVRSFTDPELQIQAAVTVTMAHLLAPDTFMSIACRRCGFAKPHLGFWDRPI